MNPIYVEILVGDAGRQWWQPNRTDLGDLRLGAIESFVPERPDDPRALLDACLAFYTLPFRDLQAYAAVLRELGDTKTLDFHLERHRVPDSWDKLRQEALPKFRQLYIMVGGFELVDVSRFDLS